MELEGNGYSYYVGHTTKTKKDILKIIYWENIGLTLEHEAHEYSEKNY